MLQVENKHKKITKRNCILRYKLKRENTSIHCQKLEMLFSFVVLDATIRETMNSNKPRYQSNVATTIEITTTIEIIISKVVENEFQT